MRANQFIEAAFGTNPKRPARAGSRPERGHEPQQRYVTDRKTGKQYDPDEEFDKLKNNPEFQAQMKRMATKEDQVDEIAGAFPSPSTRQKWANDAAASNRAMAAQEAERQRQANAAAAAKLAVNTADVDRLNKVSYHGADAPKPSNAEWDGDSDFLDLDGTQYSKASRMPISGDVPSDIKLVATKEGRQVYLWTRRSLKGVQGHYFYPAANPKTIQETKTSSMLDIAEMEEILAQEAKASRQLCKSSTPDEDLGASQLASCKSQGLRARDGNKSHKLGKSPKSRVKVGGHKIKGQKYGGPLPDWS